MSVPVGLGDLTGSESATAAGSAATGHAPQEDLAGEMTAVAGGLYLSGSVLVGLALLLPGWTEMETGLLGGVIGVAGVVGAAMLLATRRGLALPVGYHIVSAMLGTVLVSMTVVAGGPVASGAFGVFYVFVTAFSFYYFSLSVALVEVAAVAVGYGVALAVVNVEGAPAQWLIVTGASAMTGAMIGRLGHRIRDAFELEHRSVERLRELDEMKTGFLRAVSHELRTPLTTVIGGIGTLQAGWERLDPEMTERLLERTAANAATLERLLSDLLDLDRMSRDALEPRRRPTDVAALARRVVGTVDAADHPVEVLGRDVMAAIDAGKAERIVENLVVNAVRHTPAGTPVRVRVEGMEDEGCRIVVEDEGPGVDDADKDTIFEPFRQGSEAATSASPGTGIGLSLVAQFARLHSGRARIEDRPGGGARFVVELPGPEARE